MQGKKMLTLKGSSQDNSTTELKVKLTKQKTEINVTKYVFLRQQDSFKIEWFIKLQWPGGVDSVEIRRLL